MAVASEHIRVSEDTKERLEERGTVGDSYDDVISDLLDGAE